VSDFNDEAMQRYPFAQITPPLNWSLVALEDISADVSPGFASGKHNSDGTGIPHLRPMNVDRDGQIDLNVVKSVAESNGIELQPGDVLFNNTNSAELVGKTAVVSTRETGFVFSNHMTRIRLEFGVNPAFAARQLHFLWMVGYMKHRCTNHVNQASISSKTLAKTIPFLLPPDDEQTRIVAKLEELLSDLDAGVAELKAAQKKLGQYRQSLLKAAVEGALTAEWRAKNTPTESGAQLLDRILQERRARWEAKQLAKFAEQGKTPPKDWQKKYPEPVQPDTTDLPVLPEGWVWASVEQLAELVSGHTPKDAATVSTQDGVVPWFKVGDMNQPGNEEWMSSATVRFSREVAESLGMKIMPAGTIIFPKRGGAIATNKKRKLGVDACYDLNTMGLVPVKTISDWLWTWFIGVDLGRLIDGAIIPQINNPDIAPLCVPIPPSSEQREIISVVNQQIEAVGNQANAVELSLNQSTAQRQNILRAAFAGDLVPQDPNDEPAAALLERIRADRAERVKQPKTRKTKPKEIATMVSQLIDVLAEAGDWVPAQEAFRLCGVADGALTERIEELYAELRKLDKEGRLAVEAVTDTQGRKLYDKLKLLAI
jgi:type I restriction enzyme S subunit